MRVCSPHRPKRYASGGEGERRVLRRGDIHWANLREPIGSEPGYRRPVLIVSADAFNDSRIHTVVAVTITPNLALVDAPGNVDLPAEDSGLDRDSVLNVSQVVTLDKTHLGERAGSLDDDTMRRVEAGLCLVLQLGAEPGGTPTTPA